MINNVTLKGRLGRDPEILTTQKGEKIAKFSIATSTVSRDENGEWQKQVHWHTIIVLRMSTVSWIQDVLKQGHLVLVEGRLNYHFWKDQYKQSRKTPQIVVSNKEGKVEHAEAIQPKHVSTSGAQDNSKSNDLAKVDAENTSFLFPQSNQNVQQHKE